MLIFSSVSAPHSLSALCLSREHHDSLLHDRPDGGLRGGVRSLQLHCSGIRNTLLHTQHTSTCCQRYWVLNVHTHTMTDTHRCKHTYMYTHLQPFTHTTSWPRRSSADWWTPVQLQKTSVKNSLKIHVYTLRDSPLSRSCLDLAHRIKNVEKIQKKKEEFMLSSKNVADFSHSPAGWLSDLQMSRLCCDELFPGGEEQELCICQRADRRVSHSEIIVCMCVRTDWLTFVQCKVKWFFAAGNERLAVCEDISYHGSHKLHFTLLIFRAER